VRHRGVNCAIVIGMRPRGMLLILFVSACGDDGSSTVVDGSTTRDGAGTANDAAMIDAAPIVGEPPELVGITGGAHYG